MRVEIMFSSIKLCRINEETIASKGVKIVYGLARVILQPCLLAQFHR